MKHATTPKTFPWPEGSPEKPDWIIQDATASTEWDRICAVLDARRGLSPAWQGIISIAATAYADFMRGVKEVERLGQVEGAHELLLSTLATYHLACRECQVEPNPLVTLRAIPLKNSKTEDL